jgi:hypothetical protein
MQKSFSINGTSFQFRLTSGKVVGTDQRSDTHVWGGGSTNIINGQGSSSTKINSRVDVVRDLWLKDAQGQEHLFRFHQDIPFREGQDVHCLSLSGRDLESNKEFDAVYSVYNASVDRYWTTFKTDEVLKKPKNISIAVLIVGIPLILFYGIGLLLVGTYLYAKKKGAPSPSEASKIQKDVLDVIEKQHGVIIRELQQSRNLSAQEPPADVGMSETDQTASGNSEALPAAAPA